MNDITTSKTYIVFRSGPPGALGLPEDFPNGFGVVGVCHFKGENFEWDLAAGPPAAAAAAIAAASTESAFVEFVESLSSVIENVELGDTGRNGIKKTSESISSMIMWQRPRKRQ